MWGSNPKIGHDHLQSWVANIPRPARFAILFISLGCLQVGSSNMAEEYAELNDNWLIPKLQLLALRSHLSSYSWRWSSRLWNLVTCGFPGACESGQNAASRFISTSLYIWCLFSHAIEVIETHDSLLTYGFLTSYHCYHPIFTIQQVATMASMGVPWFRR